MLLRKRNKQSATTRHDSLFQESFGACYAAGQMSVISFTTINRCKAACTSYSHGQRVRIARNGSPGAEAGNLAVVPPRGKAPRHDLRTRSVRNASAWRRHTKLQLTRSVPLFAADSHRCGRSWLDLSSRKISATGPWRNSIHIRVNCIDGTLPNP